jgi:PAS domain-containing protein
VGDPERPEGHVTGHHRILLAADHREHRHLLADAAGSRAEVVEGDYDELVDGDHDLVVVDDAVLDRTWRELTWRRARERPVLLPALVLTARHAAALVAKAREGAVDDITTTPVDPGALRLRLETLLHARRLSFELARTRGLVDQLPAGVFRLGAGGEILDAGAGFAEMLGASSPTALVGTELREHLARPRDAFMVVERARAEGNLRDLELVLARADGGALPVRLFARLVVEGNDSGVSAVAFTRGGGAPAGYTVDLVTGARTPERLRSQNA